jgi:hypothetical protein
VPWSLPAPAFRFIVPKLEPKKEARVAVPSMVRTGCRSHSFSTEDNPPERRGIRANRQKVLDRPPHNRGSFLAVFHVFQNADLDPYRRVRRHGDDPADLSPEVDPVVIVDTSV